MKPKAIATDRAPKAVAAYSQAVHCNGFIFCSGQIPLDPVSGALVEGDIAVQTKRVMDNLQAVLEAAGSDFDHVARATIYLVDMNDFAKANEVYASYFKAEVKPARVTIAVAALPRAAKVEIEMTAVPK
ncbi:MAG TPA: Rid family detoxifying hydrolase [Polyangiales bacterium]|nr:Rid family detoxifying hydrolase [Polyangiales bacterium]